MGSEGNELPILWAPATSGFKARLIGHDEALGHQRPATGHVGLHVLDGVVVEGTMAEIENWIERLRWELLSGKVPGDVRCRSCRQELVIDYDSGTWVTHHNHEDCAVRKGPHAPFRPEPEGRMSAPEIVRQARRRQR